MNACMKTVLLAAAVLVAASPAAAETLPAYLEPFQNEYGYTVVRVTDPGQPIRGVDETWDPVARHHYMNDQAWSADRGLLKIDKGQSPDVYLDGQTYEPLFFRRGPGDSRWSPTIPDTEVWVEGNQVGTWNVRTDTVEVVRTFEGYAGFSFGEGVPSNDGKRIAIEGIDSSGRAVAFAYDLSTGTKFPDIPLPGVFDHARISPLGDLLAVQGGWTSSHDDQRAVYDLFGKELGFWPEYHRPGHEDVIADQQGRQWTVGRSKDDPDKYMLIKRNLETGEAEILSEEDPSHASTRNISGEEYVYATYSSDSNTPFAGQVVRFDLDGNYDFLAYTHTTDSIYESEAHASVSPDGKRMIFASNWGDPANGVAAYVVTIPEPETLGLLAAACAALAVGWGWRRGARV